MTANGKIAMVTGAGSGIGKATALALLANGYSVVLAGRSREALERTEARLTDIGRRAMAVNDVASLRGLEGEAANAYFGVFSALIRVKDTAFDFKGRSRRPPLAPPSAASRPRSRHPPTRTPRKPWSRSVPTRARTCGTRSRPRSAATWSAPMTRSTRSASHPGEL